MCKKLCSVIHPSNSALSEDQYLTGLRIFRKIIEAENKEKNKPAADWDEESDETELNIMLK